MLHDAKAKLVAACTMAQAHGWKIRSGLWSETYAQLCCPMAALVGPNKLLPVRDWQELSALALGAGVWQIMSFTSGFDGMELPERSSVEWWELGASLRQLFLGA